MKFDMYLLRARILPAIFSIIMPIIVFNYFFASLAFSSFIGNVFAIEIVSNITISTICLYFLAEFGRIIGKNIFERNIFDDEKNMPTTNLLLYGESTYNDDYKNRFRMKVKDILHVNMPDKTEEINDEELARTKIVETMA